MAGLSQRFTAAGYDRPKYMLEAHGWTLFDHAVLSFRDYFDRHPFLFIARDVGGTADFVRARASALGIADAEIAILEEPTRGQAETVEKGIRKANVDATTPLSIFNIDTFRPGYRFPDWIDECDGYLETFVGEGPNPVHQPDGLFEATAGNALFAHSVVTLDFHAMTIDVRTAD